MIHTNRPLNIVNSRTISRPPLQTIPTNPLQYNLSSTNTHNTQHSIRSLEHKTQTSNNSIQYHNVPVPTTSSITTIRKIHILHLYHNFQQTLIIYTQTPHI